MIFCTVFAVVLRINVVTGCGWKALFPVICLLYMWDFHIPNAVLDTSTVWKLFDMTALESESTARFVTITATAHGTVQPRILLRISDGIFTAGQTGPLWLVILAADTTKGWHYLKTASIPRSWESTNHHKGTAPQPRRWHKPVIHLCFYVITASWSSRALLWADFDFNWFVRLLLGCDWKLRPPPQVNSVSSGDS